MGMQVVGMWTWVVAVGGHVGGTRVGGLVGTWMVAMGRMWVVGTWVMGLDGTWMVRMEGT